MRQRTKDLCSTLSRSRAVVFFFNCLLIKLNFCIEKITVCVCNSSLGPLKCLIRSFTLGKFLNVDNCEYICVFFNQNKPLSTSRLANFARGCTVPERKLFNKFISVHWIWHSAGKTLQVGNGVFYALVEPEVTEAVT